MTNKNLLKSKMALHNDTMQSLADYLGIARSYVSGKLNGKWEFKQSEIMKIIERYNLTNDEIMQIFFEDKNIESSNLDYTQSEIIRIIKKCNLTPDQVIETFFRDVV